MQLESTLCIPTVRVEKSRSMPWSVICEDFAYTQMGVESANDSCCDEKDDDVESNNDDSNVDKS